jgi:CheY-like chemotaxis protein
VRLLGGLTVLYVEDEADTREMMTMALEGYGARVVAGASGQMALLLLQEQRPDVIVSDLALPDLDGWALLRAIRQLPSEHQSPTPAILLSAYDAAADRRRSLATGYAMHLTKPLSPRELAESIRLVTGRTPPG